jgi:hypothetical protein
MAISIGIFELLTTRSRRRQHPADGWFLGLSGVASFAFALGFLALTLGWIQLESRPLHASQFLWLVSYFGFSAICMLAFALRLRTPTTPRTKASADTRSPASSQSNRNAGGDKRPKLSVPCRRDTPPSGSWAWNHPATGMPRGDRRRKKD